MKYFQLFLIAGFFLYSCVKGKNDPDIPDPTSSPDFAGIYEYETNDPSENHYLVFDTMHGEQKAYYFGTEASKAHGVSFFLTEVTKLKIDKKGNIGFEIGERILFETTRYKLVKGDEQTEEPVGRSSGILKYKGQITTDKIQLTCSSGFYNWWTTEMTFKKLM